MKEKMKSDIDYYQELTPFQKSVVDALKVMGFKYKYFSTYECHGYGDVNVSKIKGLVDLILHPHKDGQDQKRFEIQRALGL